MALDHFDFNERTSGFIAGDIVDENDMPVPASSITSATLTLYDAETADLDASPVLGIINSRHAQDVKNLNNVELDAGSPSVTGHFVWSVQPADNIIVTKRRQIERHYAEFTFAWSGGQFVYRCEIDVTNLQMTA